MSVAVTRAAVMAYVATQPTRLLGATICLAHASLDHRVVFSCSREATESEYNIRLNAFVEKLPENRALADYDYFNTTLVFEGSPDSMHYAPCRNLFNAAPLPIEFSQWRAC